jgi:hypothetical protein
MHQPNDHVVDPADVSVAALHIGQSSAKAIVLVKFARAD